MTKENSTRYSEVLKKYRRETVRLEKLKKLLKELSPLHNSLNEEMFEKNISDDYLFNMSNCVVRSKILNDIRYNILDKQKTIDNYKNEMSKLSPPSLKSL